MKNEKIAEGLRWLDRWYQGLISAKRLEMELDLLGLVEEVL